MDHGFMCVLMDPQTHSVGYGVLTDAQVEAIRLEASGGFPNNPALPVLVYRGAFGMLGASIRSSSPSHGGASSQPSAALERAARSVEKTFALHRWSGGWRDGVYDFHHYHSTAHEVLGCYSGRATLQLGGPDGPNIVFACGDVVVLPAGTAHKRLVASDDFRVVGAYDRGRSYDMQLGDRSALTSAQALIREVPMPLQDPVYGECGPLLLAWRPRPAPSIRREN